MTINEAIEKFESYAIAVIEGKRRSRLDKIFSGFLFLLSRLYSGVIRLRFYLYSKSIMHSTDLGCRVVSIGNLTCGGTGKTPIVELLAKKLIEQSRNVAILSRGYKSKSKPFQEKLLNLFQKETMIVPRIVSNGSGDGPILESDYAGDEPYMLAFNVPKAVVLVDKNRVAAGHFATQRYKVDTVLLDDGFQYLPLDRDLNILLIDVTNAFNNHFMLPRGLLREPITNLKRADFIFLTKSDGGAKHRHLKRFISRHNHAAKIVECTHAPKHLQELRTGMQKPLDFLAGKDVAALSAIAVPESFEAGITKLGGNIIHRASFMDHHRFRAREIEKFLKTAMKSGAKYVVTTEKDAVRFPKLEEMPIPVYFLRVEIEILDGEENFIECISKICFQEKPQSSIKEDKRQQAKAANREPFVALQRCR